MTMMMTMMRSDDICENRHGGNAESAAAFERIRDGLPLVRQAVFDFIRERGEHGATVHEVAAHLGKTPNAVSGRLTELKADGWIERTDERRGHAAVLVVASKV